MPPLVTVVTPCFNSAAYIEATIQSVLSQQYSSIEYIVMDGESTDSTAAIIEKYRSKLTYVSEPDRGQSDAINKGWRMANGEIVAWLNADDRYQPQTVAIAVNYLETHLDIQWVYGNARYVDANGVPYLFHNQVSKWDYEKLLTEVNYILQPSVFIRRRLIEQLGLLREDLHYVMDYEYWLRIGRLYPGAYVPELNVEISFFPQTKTASGGTRRVRELAAMLQEYGATTLPKRHRVDWSLAFLQEALAAAKAGQIAGTATAIAEATHYPAGFFYALARMGRHLLPSRLRSMFRHWFATRRTLQ